MNSRALRTLVLAAAFAGSATTASAATLYWDGDTTAGTGNAASAGGTGSWNTTDLEWDPGSGLARVAWSNTAPDDAVFAGTLGTVTIGSNITAGTLTFNTSGYTLAGTSNSVGLTVGTIDISSLGDNGTLTVSAKLTGNSALTLRGAGNVSDTGGGNANLGIRLTNTANDFVGDVTITNRLVSYASNAVFGNAANKIILNGGGLLDNNVSVALSRNIEVLSGGGLIRFWNTSNTTWSGAITGSGNLKRTDMGTLALSGDLSGYTGTFSHATSAASAIATSITGGGVIGGNWTSSTGTLTFNSASSQSVAGTLTGTFVKSGAGVLTLSNATVGGNWTINSGGGLLVSSASNQSLGGTLAGAGPLAKGGAGTLTVTARSNYDGAITVSGGTLRLNDARDMNGAIVVSSGATLQLENNGAGGYYQPGSLTVNGGTVSTVSNGSNRYHGIYTASITASGTSSIGTPIYISQTGATSTEVLAIDIATGSTTTVSGSILYHPDISGGGINKTGAGTLVLSGGALASGNSTTLTGNITVSGGVLEVARTTNNNSPTATALGNMTTVGRTITVASGATLRFAAADAIGQYDYASPVALIADGGTITRHTNGTFNSVGALTLRNGGKVVTTNGNAGNVGSFAFNGTVTVDGTSATASSIEPLSGQGTNNFINLGTNASSLTTFDVTNTTAATALTVTSVLGDRVLGGAATLLKTGGGRMLLAASNTYTGGTTLRAGTLVGSNANAFGTGGTVTINDASTGSSNTTLLLDASAGGVSVGRAITVANQGTGTVTLGSATSSGSGQATFSGAVTLNRATTISGGSAGDRLAFTGGITGTANVTIAGTNRVIFGGSAVNYAGTTTINPGATLQLSDGTVTSTSFLADTQEVVVNGILNLAKGANNESIGGLSGSGTVNQLVAGDATLTVGGGNASASFSGALTNTGGTLGLTKVGTGTQTLTGASSHTGATTVSNGTLALGTGGSLGNTAISVANGAVLTTASGTSASGSVALASGASLRGSGSLGATTVANGTASLVAGNGTSGSMTLSSLTFDGTGTLTIGSLANYTSSAAFVITNALALNGGAVTLSLPAGVISNGTYKLISYGSSSATEANFSVTGPVIGARQSGGLVKDSANKVFQYVVGGDSPKWTGANGSAFNGDNNWKLITSNTATDFLANDSLLLDDTASSYTVDISGGNVAPAAIAFDNSSQNYVLQGDSGLASGTLSKSGTGDLRINNSNSVSSVSISGGSVTLGSSGALGASTVTLSGGTLDLNGQTTAAAIVLAGGSIAGGGTVSASISGSGALAKSSAGILTLSARNTFSGGTTVSDGKLVLGNATDTLSDAGSVSVSGGELSLGANSDTVGAVTLSGGSITGTGTLTGASYAVSGGTISAKLGGAGALTKSGAGTATLSAANTYSGGTTLSNGTLAVGDNLALGSASVALDGGTLQLSGQTLGNAIVLGGGSVAGNGTLSGVVSGSSGLTKSGAGALTLSGANTFSGSLTVSGGSLTVSGTLGSGGSYSGAIALNGSDALTLASSSNQTLSGVISGSRGLVKSGSGNLTLSGDSTFTGDITLSGGTTYVSRTNNVASPVSSALGNLTTANRRITVGNGATLNFVNADVLGQYNIKPGVTLVADGGTITRSYSAANYFNSLGDIVLRNGGRLVAASGGNSDVRSFALNGTITVEGATGGSIESTATSLAGIHLGTVGGNTTFDVADTGSTDDLLVSAPLVNQVFLSAASLTKTGAGRMALTGSNAYTGSTIISAGTLALTSGGGIYRGGYIASGISVASGATLEVDTWHYNETNASLGGLAAFASSITVNGGTIRVTGSTTYGRGITVNSGGATLEAAAGATWNLDDTGDGNVAFVYNANPSMTLTGAGNGTFNKAFSGSGSLTKSGSGTWTLSAASSYTGGTTVSAGKLIIGNLAALGTGDVSVAGGVLDLNDLIPVNVIVVSGGSLLNAGNWAAAGTVQLSGNVDASLINSLPTAEIKVAAGATVNLTGVTKDIVFEGGSLSNLSGFSGKLKVKGSLDLSSADPVGEIEVAAGGTVDFGNRASNKTVKFTGGSVTGSGFTGTVEVVGTGITLGSGIQSGTVRLTAGNSAAIQSGFNRDIAFAGGSLSGLGNYSGTVSLESGATLSVGDTTAASIELAAGSTLKGTGTVGSITQVAGSVLAPGNSPGLLTAGTFELAGGASMQVEFIAGSGVRGQAYDAVTVTGELDLSGLGTGNRYTLNLVSLSALPSTGGPLDGFDDSSAYIYELFTYATLTLPESYTGNIADLFTISTAAFVPGIDNPWASGAWTIFNNEGTKTLELQYAPIPEPSTYGLILGGLALAAAAARRRRKS